MPNTVANPDIAAIFKKLVNDIKDLSIMSLKKYKDEAKKDSVELLNTIEEDLKRWIILLADGKLTTRDFEWLIKSQKDTIEMSALKLAGLNLIRVDEFKSAVFNLIVDTIFDIIKPIKI